jgi:hypothetical protein
MAISFVGAQGAPSNSVAIPAHQVGDIIFIFAFRDGSNTAPGTPTAGGTVPSWVLINSAGANTCSSNCRYFVATATTTTSGTWPNATEVLCMVYRGARLGGAQLSGAATNVLTFPALTLQRTNNTSWVIGFTGHRTATNVEVAPTGMTNRISAGTETAGHDTNGTVASWTSRTVTVNATSGSRTLVAELRDSQLVLTAAAGARTISGVDATISKTVSKTIVADKGTFTVGGVPAALNHNAVLVADKGTITATYNPAGVRATHLLTAAVGAIAVVGKDANLTKVVSYNLIAVAGQITVLGQPAGVLITRRLTAVKGTVTVGLVPATLRRTLKLVASTRAFNITGRDAGVIYTGSGTNVKSLYYQSIVTDPRKSLVSLGNAEDQLVYYVNNIFRIL